MSQKVYIAVIGVLILIILLQRSCTPEYGPGLATNTKEIVYDTIWRDVVKTEYKKLKVFSRDTSYLPGDTVFKADPSYDKLKIQYELLVNNYAARNIYRDSLQLDTLGYIVLLDTLQYNKVQSRTYNYNYKLPTVIGFVQTPPRRQLYIGGGISIDRSLGLSNLQAGLLYKTRKDQIFGLHTGISQNLEPYLGGSMYWKIQLKK